MFLLITHSVYVPYILSKQNLAKEQTNNTTSSIEPASTLFVYLFFCLSRVHGHNGIYVWYSRRSITLWFCITHKYIKCKIMSLEVRLQFGSFSIVCCLCSLFCVCCVRCRPMVPHRSRTGMDNNGAYVSARARACNGGKMKCPGRNASHQWRDKSQPNCKSSLHVMDPKMHCTGCVPMSCNRPEWARAASFIKSNAWRSGL